MAKPPLASLIWKDGPASMPTQPVKHEIRQWGTYLEGIVDAFTSNGGLIYDTLAMLHADTGFTEKRSAWVINDPVVGNNGVYGFNPASHTWSRKADLPFPIIVGNDAGVGTPNAIQIMTAVPVSPSSMIRFEAAKTNTTEGVTLSINGGDPMPIKTNSGGNVSAGGILAGMILFGAITGSDFRLQNDQSSAAIIAAAEAARDAAEDAASLAEGVLVNAVQQTYAFASAGIVSKLGRIEDGATDNSIIGDPGDGTPIDSALFATADFPFYSVGGYVPGEHMFAQSIITMRTTRDENAQEQAIAIQFVNETGQPSSSSTSINNGKSGLTVHGRAVEGGGNMWGAAIAIDIEENYDHGFVTIIEFDINNRNKNAVLGGDFNAAGIFMNSISHYTSTAGIWMTGYDLQPNETWLYGMFFQGPMVIKDATILEDSGSDVVLKINGIGTTPVSGKNAHDIAVIQNLSTSPYLILDQGYHQNAAIRDASNAPVGLDIAGIKGAFAIRATDSAPVGISVQGIRATAAIDVSQATTGNGLNLKELQAVTWGQYQIYNNATTGKLMFRRTSDAVDLMSLDGNGNLRLKGAVTPSTTTL